MLVPQQKSRRPVLSALIGAVGTPAVGILLLSVAAICASGQTDADSELRQLPRFESWGCR